MMTFDEALAGILKPTGELRREMVDAVAQYRDEQTENPAFGKMIDWYATSAARTVMKTALRLTTPEDANADLCAAMHAMFAIGQLVGMRMEKKEIGSGVGL